METNIVTQVILPISLAFIMLTLGLALTWGDFRRVALQPRDFFVGAVSQVVILPLVAFALVSVWPIEPALAVGVMILAACPGGVTSNLMTHLARGDTALSVSLTAVISVLTVVTLPFIVGFSITHFMDAATAPRLDIGTTVIGVFVITTVPVLLGMLIKHFVPGFAARFERIGRHVATVLFILIVLGAIYSERAHILDYFAQAGPITLALNILMLGIAFGLGLAFRLGPRQRTAITLECGLQNSTLAIFVGATLIGNTAMIVPGGIYGLLMFVTAGAYMWGVLRRPAAA
ncbi:MAG: bile acid:sodium symporter family protein [Bauldia litoralis]